MAVPGRIILSHSVEWSSKRGQPPPGNPRIEAASVLPESVTASAMGIDLGPVRVMADYRETSFSEAGCPHGGMRSRGGG